MRHDNYCFETSWTLNKQTNKKIPSQRNCIPVNLIKDALLNTQTVGKKINLKRRNFFDFDFIDFWSLQNSLFFRILSTEYALKIFSKSWAFFKYFFCDFFIKKYFVNAIETEVCYLNSHINAKEMCRYFMGVLIAIKTHLQTHLVVTFLYEK